VPVDSCSVYFKKIAGEMPEFLIDQYTVFYNLCQGFTKAKSNAQGLEEIDCQLPENEFVRSTRFSVILDTSLRWLRSCFKSPSGTVDNSPEVHFWGNSGT
jgi:hypothetical protein